MLHEAIANTRVGCLVNHKLGVGRPTNPPYKLGETLEAADAVEENLVLEQEKPLGDDRMECLKRMFADDSFIMDPWFMRFQRDALAMSLAGDAAPFEPVARQALRTESRQTFSEADIDYILAGFPTLPAFDDAAPVVPVAAG